MVMLMKQTKRRKVPRVEARSPISLLATCGLVMGRCGKATPRARSSLGGFLTKSEATRAKTEPKRKT